MREAHGRLRAVCIRERMYSQLVHTSRMHEEETVAVHIHTYKTHLRIAEVSRSVKKYSNHAN